MNEWLSLSDAANILGVHPSTVRVWSDKGILPVRKTQGGHRRYKRSEITIWAESNIMSRLEAGEMMQEMIRNLRIQITEGSLEKEDWYQKLNEEARTQYRLSGRSLFHGLMNYVAAEGEDATTEAYAIGYEYASRARRYELSYVDATRAFLFFRSALIESVMDVYRKSNIPFQESLNKIFTFTDSILVTLLDTYQKLEASR